MKTVIVIPARYESTRFPGKPLTKIAGQTMLSRVVSLAQRATEGLEDANILVTTDDKRIADHAQDIGIPCLVTPPSIPTGSDRVLSALRQLDTWPDFVINLQGDAPFTPPSVVRAMIDAFARDTHIEVVTPIHQLSWDDLDRLRESKKETPYSGTTVTTDKNGRALWFSKNIIPAIRKEAEMRDSDEKSPVFQHMGLYGFRPDILERFCDLDQGTYEALEGLEQLRMLENGIKIQTVEIEIDSGLIQSGIDTPEDLERAEQHLAKHGDPLAA